MFLMQPIFSRITVEPRTYKSSQNPLTENFFLASNTHAFNQADLNFLNFPFYVIDWKSQKIGVGKS